MRRNVLSSWKAVELEVAHNVRIVGLLELEDRAGQIVFLWSPESQAEANMFDPTLSSYKVAIYLQNIEKITADDTHSDYGSIDIKFKDGKNFPAFYFTKFGSLSVNQLLAYLTERKLAEYEMSSKSIVHVMIQTTRNLVLPDGFMAPSRFLVLVSHWKVLDSLGIHSREKKEPLTVQEFESHVNEDGSIGDIEAVRQRILESGMDGALRGRIWPVLVGVYPASAGDAQKREIDTKNLEIFQELKRQFQVMVEIKHRAAWYVSLSVSTDTVWLRSEPKFCEFVKDILFAYSQYNRECGHVTGLADVLTSIVHVFVEGKIDESVTMTDGRTMNRDEALSFVFWNFVGFIERNKRDQIFTYPLEAQHFSSERVFTIIKEVDPVLASWMELHDLTDLSFLYKKVVLSFQRDLESESLLKLWDAIAAAPEHDQLLRFFSASFIISLFLPCLEKDVGNPSDFVDVMDDVSKSSNIADLLEMTVNLISFVKSKPALEWIFMAIPGNEKFQDFTPTMLTIH